MPEKAGFSRLKLVRRADMPPPATSSPYVELGVTSPFSFLRGASDAIELVLTALPLGMDALGVADRNTLAGVVRMHGACKEAGLKPLIGCRRLRNRGRGQGCQGRRARRLRFNVHRHNFGVGRNRVAKKIRYKIVK